MAKPLKCHTVRGFTLNRNFIIDMNQDWLELKDIRDKSFNKKVWVPVRAKNVLIRRGESGHEGYTESFFGLGSLLIPVEKKSLSKNLGWMEIGISHDHSGYYQDNRYIPSEIYEYGGEFLGLNLILEQRLNSIELNEWHLHQDFITTLRLKREGDVWLAVDEGYVEAAKLLRKGNGEPAQIDIKA